MKVLSLFDVISCGMIALERAGIPIDSYYASEIDQKAIAISEKNHKNIIRLGDVTKWKEWNLPKIDLVIGGSPCQGFSRAGKCLNFEDPRSKLFFEYVDILNSIREKNPDVLFLLENVKMKNEWKDVISNYLGVQPIEINSSLVSGQNRKRLYWTNIESVEQPQDKGIKLIDILEDVHADESFIESEGLLFDPSISEASRKLVKNVNGEIRIKQSVKCGYIVAENGDGINISFPLSKSRRGRVIKHKSSTLDCACNICVLQNGVIRKFTKNELERLQTLPDGYTEGFSKTVSQKAIGNGWTVDVIAHIFTYIKKEKEKEMELKIYSPTEDGFIKAIEWNHEEIKKEVAEKVSYYANLVYTDDQIKNAKADRAKLNKFVNALEEKRKEVKKQCLAPYEGFEKKLKEITSIVNEPIQMIDKQVKGYEEQKKAEKLEKIQEYWNRVTSPDHPLTLQRVMDTRWLNATTSIKSVQESINGILAKYAEDITTLQNLPEFSFEAVEVYKSTLDIGKAIQEGKRLADIQKRKEEAERQAAEREAEQARMKAEAEAKKAEEESAPASQIGQAIESIERQAFENCINPPVEEKPTEPLREAICFRAYLTTEDALALKNFFESRNIPFEAIEEREE